MQFAIWRQHKSTFMFPPPGQTQILFLTKTTITFEFALVAIFPKLHFILRPVLMFLGQIKLNKVRTIKTKTKSLQGLWKRVFCNVTDGQTGGHCGSMTESAQMANSVRTNKTYLV